MTAFMTPPERDPATPRLGEAFTVTLDGRPLRAFPGQTVAAVLLAAGHSAWRATRGAGRPRGVFCGIGVCFDCLVMVGGVPDVRACQRIVVEGDDIRTQYGAALPDDAVRNEG